MNITDFASKAKTACNTRGPATSLLRHLGIHPGVALVFVLADWLLFGGELFSGMATLPISIVIGLFLGLWAARKQYRDYHDSRKLAIAKGLVLGIITAIPTPIGSFLPVIGVLLPFLDTLHSTPDCPAPKQETDEHPDIRNVTPGKNNS